MKNIIWKCCFFVALVLELGMQTFWKGSFGVFWSPAIWMLGGVLLCISAYFLLAFNQIENPKINKVNKIKRLLAASIVFVFGAGLCGFKLWLIFQDNPVDPSQSDIIPSLQFYVRRLLTGEMVYRDMPFEGYTVQPTYLPMLWLPYCFSEILHIDYRWTAYLLFLLAIILLQIKESKKQQPWPVYLIKLCVPFVFIGTIAWNLPLEFGDAVELTPVAFYLFLAFSIFHRSRFLLALGIILCLLSRYAFTFWLPVYLLIYWIEKGFPSVFKVGLWVAVGVLLIYIVPFLSKDWTGFLSGLAYYSKTAESLWIPFSWQAEGEYPFHLQQGLSYAVYFYEYGPGDYLDKLSLNRKVHLAIMLLLAGFIFMMYWFWRKKNLNVPIFLLISLKLYLIFFYGFFYTPFNYLFQLVLFLNIPILYALYSGKRILPNTQ